MIRESRKNTKAVLVIGMAISMLAAAAVVNAAQADDPPILPIAADVLTPQRAVFPDDIDLKIRLKEDGKKTIVVNQGDPSRTVVVKYTVQPGAQFPWHSHAGPVVVNLVSGALTYVSAEERAREKRKGARSPRCSTRAYEGGEAFVDPGHGHVHSAFNPTDTPTVFYATFLGAPPAPASLLITADPASC